MNPSEKWTILKLLNWAVDYFKKHNISEAKRNAELLLAHALNVKILDLYLQFEKEVTPEQLARFKQYIIRRLKGEPVQYICGETSFFGYPIKVNPKVLIPRFETEFVVETSLPFLNETSGTLLDLGTGSGAIVIALAKQLKTRYIYIGSDISQDSLQIAQTNAQYNSVNIHFVCANLLDGFKPNSLDVILSNPPYIPTSMLANLPPEVRNYEPILALDGGPDGLTYYKKILTQAKSVLRRNGLLIFEIDDKKVMPLAEAAGFEILLFKNDYNARPRVLILKKI